MNFSRETSLNLSNLIIMSGICIVALAVTFTCLGRPERVLAILNGMSAQSRALKFELTPEHAKLSKRVWLRATSAFTFMCFLSVYEPFVWPDYFLLADLVARLWWSIVIALFEMQVVCFTDAFANLFKTLNRQLESERGASIETLRIVHDELCDLLILFQVSLKNYKCFKIFSIIFIGTLRIFYFDECHILIYHPHLWMLLLASGHISKFT